MRLLIIPLLLANFPVSLAAEGAPPNLIYIMADDLGYGDLGCFGQKQIQTPHLDQLASEGMKLTSFYTGCTVCRPSRLSLWTGKHMGHTPIWSNARYQFENNEPTIPELLKAKGYATGGVGKWAMGGVGTPGHPNKNGFDLWFGYLDQGEAHNYYPTHLWRNRTKVPLPGNVLSDAPQARGRVATKRTTWSHTKMTDAALDFVRSNKDNPFLLHIHCTVPHANNEGGRVTGDGMEVPDHGIYADRDWPSTAKGQAQMVSQLDADVGKLVALLRQLKIAENTLVIFTSDNGPHSEGGHKHEFFDANGPLRGYKRDLYEGGIRVPTIAWRPGHVPAGTTNDTPLAFWDVLPTFCELAGTTPTPDTDGQSFTSILSGEASDLGDRPLFWRYQKKSALRLGPWKAVRLAPDKPLELYNLTIDQGETNNVADLHPEIAKKLEALMASSLSPPVP